MDKNNRRSFTLVETLIVAVIILLLSGTSMVMLTSYKDSNFLDSQVSLLTHIFELAKNKAVASDVSLCSDSQTAYVSSYSVNVDSVEEDAKFIVLMPDCSTTPFPQKYSIPDNIVYVTPTFSVRFDNKNYLGTTRKFPIMDTATKKCKYVQIDEMGIITSGDYDPCP